MQNNNKIKFIFDLDGTITAKETLPMIAHHFQIQDEIHALTEETIHGKIPFIESFIRRVFMLGKLPVSEISTLLKDTPLHLELLSFIKQHIEKCVVATGNLSCWTKELLDKIGCEFYCSEATVENNMVVKIDTILRKESIVEKFKNEGYKVVFVGDGNNDLEAMRKSDITIAVGITHYPSKSILPFANYLIFNEKSLCRQLNQLL